MSYKDNPMLYTGLRLPDGTPLSMYGNIMQNGDRAEEAENAYMNQNTYWMYLWRLMDLSISVFDWQNLPKGVDERMLEFWLMRNGFCVFFSILCLFQNLPLSCLSLGVSL